MSNLRSTLTNIMDAKFVKMNTEHRIVYIYLMMMSVEKLNVLYHYMMMPFFYGGPPFIWCFASIVITINKVIILTGLAAVERFNDVNNNIELLVYKLAN